MRYFISTGGHTIIGLGKDEQIYEFTEVNPVVVNVGVPTKMTIATPRKEKKKKGNKCGICFEYGHNKATCPKGSDDLSDLQEAPKPRISLTPDKLAKVKKMLSEGESHAAICDEVGVSDDTVERIATSLGL